MPIIIFSILYLLPILINILIYRIFSNRINLIMKDVVKTIVPIPGLNIVLVIIIILTVIESFEICDKLLKTIWSD